MKIMLTILSILLLLVVWQITSIYIFENSPAMPTPKESFKALITLLLSGEIFSDIIISLYRVLTGFGLGSMIGVILAIIVFLFQYIRSMLIPIIELFRPIPPVAFVPLAILWFGLGDGASLFLVAFATFFPVFTSTEASLSSVPQNYIDTALTLGATKPQLLRYVYFPAALPGIMSGLKTGLGTAWFVLIVAELVGAQSGLGYFIQLHRLTLQSDNVIAGMICIGFIGFVMGALLSLLGKVFCKG